MIEKGDEFPKREGNAVRKEVCLVIVPDEHFTTDRHHMLSSRINRREGMMPYFSQ